LNDTRRAESSIGEKPIHRIIRLGIFALSRHA
jgi:hypothetical protein